MYTKVAARRNGRVGRAVVSKKTTQARRKEIIRVNTVDTATGEKASTLAALRKDTRESSLRRASSVRHASGQTLNALNRIRKDDPPYSLLNGRAFSASDLHWSIDSRLKRQSLPILNAGICRFLSRR